MSDESEFLRHESCPKCGSKDNLARYTDGHAFCFGCEHYEPGEGEPPSTTQRTRMPTDLIDFEPQHLAKRNLTEETCSKFGYGVGEHAGRKVQVACYKMGGRVVAQKIRTADKDFYWKGEPKEAGLFGQHLWQPGGKKLVITEGEIDALTVSQLQNNKWPVVSLPNGAHNAKRDVAKQLDFVSSFDQVVLMFDQDEAGREAAEDVAILLPPGKARIAELPLKDANEMLVAGRGADVITAMWNAQPWRPDGVRPASDFREDVLRPPPVGLCWPWPTLTKLTNGVHRKKLYGFGAGTGVGKTTSFIQVAAHRIAEDRLPVGMIMLEQSPDETIRLLAGAYAGKPFDQPEGWTTEELTEALDAVEPYVHLVDHWGAMDWESVKSRIEYLATACEIKDIFLDHLTALAAVEDDEKKALERIMAELASLVQRLGITIYYVSHLATPHGTPHEEGGRVMIRHFKGSRAIGFWSHFMFGLERDQQAEDEDDRQTTLLRTLKARGRGKAVGKTVELTYQEETGRMVEKPSKAEQSVAESFESSDF